MIIRPPTQIAKPNARRYILAEQNDEFEEGSLTQNGTDKEQRIEPTSIIALKYGVEFAKPVLLIKTKFKIAQAMETKIERAQIIDNAMLIAEPV